MILMYRIANMHNAHLSQDKESASGYDFLYWHAYVHEN